MGETNIPLCGYATSSPRIQALTGKYDDLQFDSATHLFTFTVSPHDSRAFNGQLGVGNGCCATNQIMIWAAICRASFHLI